MQADLPYLLSEAALRRLTGLVHLALRDFTKGEGENFPVALARATPYLTHLDLRENGFDGIPTAIMGLDRPAAPQYFQVPAATWATVLGCSDFTAEAAHSGFQQAGMVSRLRWLFHRSTLYMGLPIQDVDEKHSREVA